MKTPYLTILLLLLPYLITAQDAEGCKDHPLISRFPNAQIIWCNAEDFAEYHIATGPVTGYQQIDEWVDLEGKVYRYNYELRNTSNTMNEVHQNYRNAIKSAGFEILAEGSDPNRDRMKANEVGGRTWVPVANRRNLLPTNSMSRLNTGSASSGGYGFVAGRLKKPEGNVFVAVSSYQYRSDIVVIQVDIIEEKPLDDGKITITPDYLAQEIATKGTVTLAGIFFDFDQAIVKPESADALAVIATYLKQHPDQKFFVVGHTDYKGNLGYNLNLSKQRAEAIVAKLVSEHGIAKERLESQGVGPLAPRTTNESEIGREKNRRVELVLSL